ncbi:MAG: hypothetical protein Tsb0034_22250 [Ekhidna sp.]
MDYRQEQIEKYHSGRMSSEEAAAFENVLASDPSLKMESDFQSDIIRGLKDYRKAQLKSRLDAIDVSPSWIEFAQQSTLMKSFGGVAVATLIGTGVYFYAEPTPNASEGEAIVVDAPNPTDMENIWMLGEEDIPQVAQLEEKPSNKVIKEQKVEKQEDTATVVATVSAAGVDEKPKAFAPSFDAPDASAIQDEEALKTENLDELPATTAAEVSETPINVETEIVKSLVVKYKYYDGKLFLSGDFDRAPYEILEINTASGRRIYVKYLDKYYQVGVTDQLSTLPEVTDQAVIDELKLLRNNK